MTHMIINQIFHLIKESDLIYNDTSTLDSNSITKTFNWYQDNEFSNEDFKLSVKKNYLYENYRI